MNQKKAKAIRRFARKRTIGREGTVYDPYRKPQLMPATPLIVAYVMPGSTKMLNSLCTRAICQQAKKVYMAQSESVRSYVTRHNVPHSSVVA